MMSLNEILNDSNLKLALNILIFHTVLSEFSIPIFLSAKAERRAQIFEKVVVNLYHIPFNLMAS